MKRPHLPPSSHQPERILVIKFRHHGDMLLTTPVIRSLTAAWPEAEIDVLLYEETRAMLACHPDIHRIYAIDRTWKKEGLRFQLGQEWRLLKILRQQRYDVVVNLADQWRSAIITRFTGAPVRLGFDFPKRQGGLWQRCHTHLVATDQHQTMHTVEQNLSLLHPLNLAAIDSTVGMHYSPDDAHAVQRLLNGTEKYIVIQPTSRWFFKCWSEEKFAAVLQSLRDDGHTIVLTSGPDTKELGMVKNIISLLSSDDKVISLAGQLTLNQLAALIDEAGLFIGVDSVPMHMAAALKTPCIALFGPSKLVFWRPWQVNGEVIWAGDFAPLPDPDSVDTKTSERYLDAIPVETVLNAARRLLA
ncbi:putative lipopolysaccharide heptosyltransferase III [Erwinia amylovora]|uniref:Heptosyl III transferase WaaQ (Glycosyl transferase, family 9) n=3 Tax=Erwinia amylovora TaxID=552 RepID=A0A831ERZ7_ERWAM|nr:putative lipopolysaccharide heptosyltransferase III [Erwinia amylovora]CDK13711.1 putative heptosyl III transferase WaaQ (Glycosyl transferase, family 9) [Erwinia amylovora LA635]CDK17078.1 putative heptosyl III transferase WaaQ (Glycosyl transferase, family 9) [Erwinia amylovora LA636]CDK20447.1 putative heptosyl III transferase WaaQ (Glycosyl transferase, family 9) [Erwinia amylovora LA637]ATZ10056.1 putative lipopolysaccharide heptosyltransferase III [Erwinia amylovora]EKV55711.1 putativ